MRLGVEVSGRTVMATVFSSAEPNKSLTGMALPRLVTWGFEAAAAGRAIRTIARIVLGRSIEASVALAASGCELGKYAPIRHSGSSNQWPLVTSIAFA